MKTFTRRATRLLTLALTVGTLIYGTAVPPAHAAESGQSDHKILPGAMCQPTDFPNNATASYSFTGKVRNEDSNQLLELVCPLVRDNAFATSGMFAQVAVRDNHPDEDIQCNLDVRDRFGNSQDSSGNKTTSGTGQQTISMSVSTSSFNNSYYYVRCVFPPVHQGGVPSDISSIRYRERS